MRFNTFILPFILSFLIVEFAYADKLIVNNGDVISGKVVSVENKLIVFSTKYDTVIKISTNEIKAMDSDSEFEILFMSNDIIYGALYYNKENEKNYINSKRFGKIEISANEIVEMKRYFGKDNQVRNEQNYVGKPVGQEDQHEPPLDFLTGSTVLLSPGTYELDFGFRYNQSRESYALTSASYFERSTKDAKRFELSASIRAGLYDGFEGWITFPYTYTSIEQVSTNEYVRDVESWDFGDISFGGQYLILEENKEHPALSLTLSVSAPTGNKTYYEIADTWMDPLNNGSGFWSVMPGLAFVRTTDPAIIYGGFGLQYSFSDTINGYHVKPGLILLSYLGLGYALNDKLSLGTKFSYAHQSNMTVDEEEVMGSGSDPMDISISFSYSIFDRWVISPGVSFGINDDAGTPSASININRKI